MKKALLLIVLILLLFSAVIVVAQNGYSISWWSIDGGAQSGSGGTFNLNGVSGQPDAGVAMTGGEFGVIGGYVEVPQSSGAPPDLKVYLPAIIK